MTYCVTEADEGGNAAVIGNYAVAILLSSPLIGTIVGYNTQDAARAQGERDQVDRCMAERGFKRRNLNAGERFWLRDSVGEERERRLDPLVSGGTVETYGAPKS